MVDRKNRAHALTARRGEKRSSCARSQFRPPQGSRSPSAELAAANAWLDRDDEAKAAIDGLHELMPVQRRIVRGGIKLDRLERAASSDERIDLALA